MAKKGNRGKRFTPEQRAQILATAQKEGMTGADVKKRWGVSTVTYYLWKKKAGVGGRRGRRPGMRVAATNGNLNTRVRGEVASRMRDVLPRMIDAEIKRYLDMALGSGGGRRRRG